MHTHTYIEINACVDVHTYRDTESHTGILKNMQRHTRLQSYTILHTYINTDGHTLTQYTCRHIWTEIPDIHTHREAHTQI